MKFLKKLAIFGIGFFILAAMVTCAALQEQKDREYCESQGLVYHQPWKSKAICVEGKQIPKRR